jgi:hypothetical protein
MVPGDLPAQGHWDASEAFERARHDNTSIVGDVSFRPFQWQHKDWADLVTEYVARLHPAPTWLYLNAHYWPNNFPSVGSAVIQAAAGAGMKTVWSTATVSKNFKAQLKFRDVDRDMCSLADFYLNNTWMENDLTSRDMQDSFHFKPHVYKILNQRLLSVLGL